MVTIHKLIDIVKENDVFHILEPLSSTHLITDEIGAFIARRILAKEEYTTVLFQTIQKFNIDVTTASYYISNLVNSSLFENQIQAPPPGDYLRGYRFLPDGYSFHPNYIYWVVTWKCNLRCRMCPLWSQKTTNHKVEFIDNRDVLSFEQTKRIVDNIAKTGILAIQITGGEPVLFPHLVKTVEYIKSKQISVTVFTNGTLIDNAYAEELVDTGIDKIGISLDGTENVHDKIRGKGNFSRAIEGINSLVTARNNITSNTRLYIMNTITNYNISVLTDLMQLVSQIGADGMFVAHPSFSTPSSFNAQMQILTSCFFPMLEGPSWQLGQAEITDEVNAIEIDEILETMDELKKMATDNSLEFASSLNMSRDELLCYYNIDNGKVIDRCLWPWFGSFVDPQGWLYPCVKFRIGNLMNADFIELWNGDIYRRFRRLVKREGILPSCERCCQLVNEQARTDALQIYNQL